MTEHQPKPTMTDLLREALNESGESLYAIALRADVNKASLIRFLRGSQSLRLDVADKLAAYLGVECRRVGRRKG